MMMNASMCHRQNARSKGMTEQRKDEIVRKVFYRHIESIMRTLEPCED